MQPIDKTDRRKDQEQAGSEERSSELRDDGATHESSGSSTDRLQSAGVSRPSGSQEDDPAFRQAYPYGTYGYGPKGRLDEPASDSSDSKEPAAPVTSGESIEGQADEKLRDGTGGSPLSPLIDFERPGTSLSNAQHGEAPERTGER